MDGIRGLAIAMVVVYHYASVNAPPHKFLYYALLPTHLMWSGVDLFFVLSGFLIGGILLDNKESRRYFSAFYARRVHRIFPLYYLMIVLLVVGVWLFPCSPLFVGRIPLWIFPLYAQNLVGDFTLAPLWFGVAWSLAVEEQFYLLFPMAVRFLSRKALVILVGACIGGALFLRALLIWHGWGFEQVYPLLPCRADALAFGVGAALIVRNEEAKSWIRKHSKMLYGSVLVLVALLPTLLKWPAYFYLGTLGYSILDVLYFLLIVLVLVAPTPRLLKAFRIRWLGWLGTVSYCVYLVHEPVRAGLFLLLRPEGHSKPAITGTASLLVTIAAVLGTLAIAQVSWLIFEKPLIARAHRLYRY